MPNTTHIAAGTASSDLCPTALEGTRWDERPQPNWMEHVLGWHDAVLGDMAKFRAVLGAAAEPPPGANLVAECEAVFAANWPVLATAAGAA